MNHRRHSSEIPLSIKYIRTAYRDNIIKYKPEKNNTAAFQLADN